MRYVSEEELMRRTGYDGRGYAVSEQRKEEEATAERYEGVAPLAAGLGCGVM